MPVHIKEAQIALAITALQSDPKLSLRKAASIYSVSRKSLKRRIDGILPQAGRSNVNANLTKAEEEVIIQYILDLDSRGFSPKKAEVEDDEDEEGEEKPKKGRGKGKGKK